MNMEQTTEKVSTAKVIYILLIVGTIIGITGIIGLIMAYVMKDGSEHWLQSHYRFQIRTYWIGLLYTIIGVITLSINIGYLVLLFAFVWLIVRCTKGLKQLEQRQPVKNLESWLFT
jgi:uncharacterized membrane protein